LGGIPGTPARAIVRDLVAPPLPPETKDRDGALDVTVRDGEGGPPAHGAHVRGFALIDGRAYLADERDTDEAGRAHLAHLPHAETWVIADAPGRARAEAAVVVDADPRALSMVLLAEHALDVAVTDDAGQAVSSAEVEVVASSDLLPVGARTGEDGVAHVGRLGAGPWSLTARAQGLEDGTARASHDGERVAIVLRKLGAIGVHVVGADDRPLAGAEVEVAGAALWPARSAGTDQAGYVRIGGLAAGVYALRAKLGERVSPIELGVLVSRGEETPLTLRALPGRRVAVRVTDGDADDADPVGGARVTLAEAGLSPFPIEATTDAKGKVSLGPFSPGAVTLSARAEGFVARGGVAVGEPPPSEVRVALVHAGTLTGRVVDGRGYPIDGATIQIVGTEASGAPVFDDPRRAAFQAAHFDAMLAGPAPLVPGGELGVMPGPVPAIPHEGARTPSTELAGGPTALLRGRAGALAEPWVTRADGTFRASPATPGRVRAIVHHPQFIEAESDLVTLAAGGEAQVSIVMHEGGSLEGHVVDARDRPVAGAHVVVLATSGTMERTTRSGTDGSFAFASLPEEVILTAGLEDDAEQPDVRMTVTIAEGGKKELTVHLPEPRQALPVTVVDAVDRPIDAAQVSASSLAVGSPLRTTAFTDKRGETVLKRGRGVALRIEVSAPGHAPRVVTTDETSESLRVSLSPAETATGEVVAARGRQAVAGAEVALATDLGVRRARTDSAGAFSIADLAPGPATLRVRAAGFAPLTRGIVVSDSGGRRPFAVARVELSAEGVVEGQVVDVRGDPVAGARVAHDHVPTWLVVGANPEGMAITDARGHFSLPQLAEGTVSLEAYAPDVGRARAEGVKVVAGRVTVNVRIVLARDAADRQASHAPAASGGVAVTLGETGEPVEVVVVSVVEGSAAERAGLSAGDVLASVDGVEVHSMGEARTKLGGPVADDVVLAVRRGDAALTLRVAREPVRR
jgi:hypothetical protein